MSSPLNIDDITKQSLLYDFYGQLLTDRQRQVFELYHGENLSLTEIAAELQISRQGVHDGLRSARRALTSYEERLGLVARFLETDAAIDRIDGQILEMIGDLEEGSYTREDLIRRLGDIKAIIDRLEG